MTNEMTAEEARAYFIKCNENLISVAKDENMYSYERQEIEPFCLRRAFEANKLAIQALETQRWIPVSARLPEKYKYTLWCASSGHIQSDYFNGEFWEEAKKYGYEVVAWMPLPQQYGKGDAE